MSDARREFKKKIKMMANLCFFREKMCMKHDRSTRGGGGGVYGFNSKMSKIIKMNAIKLSVSDE